MPASVMLPERRLEALVEQALEAQLSKARRHNAGRGLVSLLTDYYADSDHIPNHTSQVWPPRNAQHHSSKSGCAASCNQEDRQSFLIYQSVSLAHMWVSSDAIASGCRRS